MEEQVQWALTYVQGGSADVWKENLLEELESGEVEIRISGGIFYKFKERIWRRRGRVGQGGGIEKAGARRENDGRICSGVQKGSKRERI